MPKNPIVHFEIGCTDGLKTREFFGNLFDWEISGPESGFVIDPGTASSGSMEASGAKASLRGHLVELAPEWGHYVTIYVQVEDLESYLERAVELGGKVLVKPVDLPGQGRFAWIAAPEGNIVGLWNPE